MSLTLRTESGFPMVIKSLLVMFTALGLTSCASFSNLDRSAGISDNETVFVIGVRPENFRFMISPGEIKNHKFIQSVMYGVTTQAFPENGYVIAKTSGGTDLGWIGSVKYDKPGGERLNIFGQTCIGDAGMAFTPPPGKVIYLADVEMITSGNDIEFKYSQDFEKARAYIDANYLALKNKLVPWPYEIAEVRRPCTGGPIFIYVGK